MRSTDLSQANLQGAYLKRAQFASAHLRRAYLWKAKLQGAEFYGAKLDEARLREAELEGACFWRADLRGADFSEAKLKSADLREADLRGADFSGAELESADFREALLWRANLRKANFSGAKLKSADLREANLEGAQDLEFEQLAIVETLYQVRIDSSLKPLFEELRKKHPKLFNAPAPAVDHTITTASKVGRINFPKDRAEVGEQIIVRGDIDQLPPNSHLWLAVQQEDRIWPKDPEVLVTGSQWVVTAYDEEGTPSDGRFDWAVTVYEEGTPSGSEFELVLYLVETEGDQRNRHWLRIGNATDAFPALRKIPGSATLYKVHRLRMQTSSRFPSFWPLLVIQGN